MLDGPEANCESEKRIRFTFNVFKSLQFTSSGSWDKTQPAATSYAALGTKN